MMKLPNKLRSYVPCLAMTSGSASAESRSNADDFWDLARFMKIQISSRQMREGVFISLQERQSIVVKGLGSGPINILCRLGLV
jgi:hypothetical protein